MKKYIVYIFITLPILFVCCVLLFLNIPGYGEICDLDSGTIFVGLIIFIPLCIAFLILNSTRLYKQKNNLFYKVSLITFFILVFLSFGGLNKLIFITYYGTLKYKAQSIENPTVYINLYENERFYSEGFNSSCYEEINGTYEIINDQIKLKYNEESDHFSKKYVVKNGILVSLDKEKDDLMIEKE